MAPKKNQTRLSTNTSEAKIEAARVAAAEQKKKDQSALIGALKKTSKEGAAEVLDAYQKLGRFDAEKNAILQKYINDKTISWMNSYLEEKKFVQSEVQEGAEGHTSQRGVAKLLGMSADDPALAAIVGEAPCDEDWGSENAIERGFKKAGLKRYKLSYMDGLIKETSMKEESSSMSSEANLKNKKALANASRGSSVVKIELKEYGVLKSDSKIISMGERKVERMLSEFKKYRSQLVVAKKPEGSLFLHFLPLFFEF